MGLGHEPKHQEEDVMSMSSDEIDEAYSPEGRNHTDDHGDDCWRAGGRCVL